jgi:hypothetical protein
LSDGPNMVPLGEMKEFLISIHNFWKLQRLTDAHTVFYLLAISLLISSCVTNKKYVYLQKDDVNVKDLPKDTIVRSYDLQNYEYRIQPEDNISVRFESLTPQEYDIFNQEHSAKQNQNLNQGNAILLEN